MQSGVFDIKCIRIQTELDKFIRDKSIPDSFTQGNYTAEDICNCIDCFDSDIHKQAAEDLIQEVGGGAASKIFLRNEYQRLTGNLATSDYKFIFPTVMSKYRPNINPVRALYYETRELIRRYNHTDERHVWFMEIMTERQFNREIIEALEKDIQNLDNIINRYSSITVHDLPSVEALVADDMELSLLLMERALRKLDIGIRKSVNGHDALDLSYEKEFAFIIMDIFMPGMTGLEVVEKIRIDHQNPNWKTPVIFVTGDDEESLRDQGYKLGAIDFMAKPVNIQQIRAKCGVLLDLFNQKHKDISHNSDMVSLELLHARQQLADFQYYLDFFTKLRSWRPN